MSIETGKRSIESVKEYKLWKIYQKLKQRSASRDILKSEGAEITDDPEEAEKLETQDSITDSEGGKGVIELLCEGDIERRLTIEIETTINARVCKNLLADVFNIPYKNIKLIQNGKKLKNAHEFHPKPGARIDIEFGLDESESENELPEVSIDPSSSSTVPNLEVFKTTTMEPGGHKKYMEVAITRENNVKQFYGGYRNKWTQQEYHHAMIQTEYKGCAEHNLSLRLKGSEVKQCTRETQTLLPLIDQGINTMANKCIQMSGRGVYIPQMTDRIISARPYQEYNAIHKKMTPSEAVTILQRAWRHYINMKRVYQKYKSIYDDRMAKEQFKGSSMVEFHKQLIALLTKNTFPTFRSDFYDLYTVLGEWIGKQKKEIGKHKSGFAYKVAMAELQNKQTQGLLAIERHRIQAKRENLQRQDIMFLEGTARSRVRKYPKGHMTFIDDLNIKRARDLKEIFASYTRTDVTKEERIEILMSIKNCLAGFEAVDLTGDLIEILEREIDFITMGINNKNMEYLKKRFETLFINLAKNPEFNPQAKYFKKSLDAEKKYAMQRCTNCHRVFYPSHMFIHLRMGRFRVCTSCSYMHSTATATINLAPYKRLLKSLRTAETEKGCRSAVPFLLQPMGMYFLVNVLWDGRSIIGGSSYLPGLKVTRWIPNEEWSMWNMILLTELEAHKHEKLENPLDFYSKEFVLNVMNRNILGRMHFRMVADIDLKFRKREPIGILPKDHLLYTSKKAASFLPKNNPHPFLTPKKGSYGGRQKAEKCDAGT